VSLYLFFFNQKKLNPLKYLIAGLGNVGSEYENTRHNIGFAVLDALAGDLKTSFEIGRHGFIANAKLKGRQLLLIKPTTFMNLSGKAVKYWLDKEDIPIENLLVVFDDLDLDLGALRMRPKGSGGTHNGINHIIETLGTTDFARLRAGIGKDFARGFQVEYVLGKWTKNEEKVLIEKIPLAVEMVKNFVLSGTQNTMNQFNRK
jgi:PTH1 family peptidyl-tRNA hydrolase